MEAMFKLRSTIPSVRDREDCEELNVEGVEMNIRFEDVQFEYPSSAGETKPREERSDELRILQ